MVIMQINKVQINKVRACPFVFLLIAMFIGGCGNQDTALTEAYQRARQEQRDRDEQLTYAEVSEMFGSPGTRNPRRDSPPCTSKECGTPIPGLIAHTWTISDGTEFSALFHNDQLYKLECTSPDSGFCRSLHGF
jgi:hypothetical protein